MATTDRRFEGVSDRLREEPLAVGYLATVTAAFLGGTALAATYGQDWVLHTFAVHPEHLDHLWTWVTSLFLHVWVVHFLANAGIGYALFRTRERWFPRRHVVAVFLLSGVMAAVIGTVLVDALDTTVAPMLREYGIAGASAGLFGLFGLTQGVAPWRRDAGPGDRQMRRITVFGIVAGVSLVGAFVWPFQFPVAHVHHLVGLLTGAGYGYVVVRER